MTPAQRNRYYDAMSRLDNDGSEADIDAESEDDIRNIAREFGLEDLLDDSCATPGATPKEVKRHVDHR